MTRRRPGPEPPALFEPEELTLRPTPHARLRKLAARASARGYPATRFEEDRETIDRLRSWGAELAEHFQLRVRSIDVERDGVVRHYGICYDDGTIRIRLRHARSGKLLKESSLVDTLCHELAHLKHLDHSIRFRRLYVRILEQAREWGYYRPGPGETRRPRQLALFERGTCGTARHATRGEGP
ncbi:MAG TPA: Wss1p-related putative metallopeptidase [Candidatus Polarisedimenticolaceae bacterium]|nr:Wss1p-related putative metallopeptidase [Candidatus Polarisedimenticolaceae bacterium]